MAIEGQLHKFFKVDERTAYRLGEQDCLVSGKAHAAL